MAEHREHKWKSLQKRKVGSVIRKHEILFLLGQEAILRFRAYNRNKEGSLSRREMPRERTLLHLTLWTAQMLLGVSASLNFEQSHVRPAEAWGKKGKQAGSKPVGGWGGGGGGVFTLA